MNEKEILEIIQSIMNAAASNSITSEHIAQMQKISDNMMTGMYDDFNKTFFEILQSVRIPFLSHGLIQ